MQTCDRWALVVLRSNPYEYEVFRELYLTEADAVLQANHLQSRIEQAEIRAVKVLIPIPA